MNSVDVSSWLLIEDSADSEEDYSGFFFSSMCPNEDDKASTCGLSNDGAGHQEDEGINEDESSYAYDNEVVGGNSTLWMSIGALEDEAETRIGDEVNVNELEDRVFWEMCMAVGYP
ncbi:hypothetical protein RIF29_08104 [Crotalaria pallida]|uniref:Uncharacterized protein n=1 Tax=Crotalaria pallida TaxID=3830 RepID=A0AAN9PBR2_CROPI